MLGILLGALVLIGGILLFARAMVSRIGCDCHRCGLRMKEVNRLTATERAEIASYFTQVEGRQANAEKMFACYRCRIVYDDFSGEKRSMDGDNVSFCKVCGLGGVSFMGHLVNSGEVLQFRQKYPDMIGQIECLHCQRNPLGCGTCVFCDSESKVTGCRHCNTLYRWTTGPRGDWKFLATLTPERVRDRPSYDAGGF